MCIIFEIIIVVLSLCRISFRGRLNEITSLNEIDDDLVSFYLFEELGRGKKQYRPSLNYKMISA